MRNLPVAPRFIGLTLVACCLWSAGCVAPSPANHSEFPYETLPQIVESDIPRELEKATLPPYRVEAPDILLIEAVHNIRPAGDKLRAGDRLLIRVSGLLPIDPEAGPVEAEFGVINGEYQVQANGTVDLGPLYGSVAVVGVTLAQAQEAIEQHLKKPPGVATAKVAVSMPDVAGKQAIVGEHLVRPDGTISLGVYGSLFVAGMTLDEVKFVVESHLAQFINQPEVRVDVGGYNSKVIYVITDGGGFGEQVVSLPFTGNETVLDAMAQIQGLPEVSSKKIWVARPAPSGQGANQTLPVDWTGITRHGMTATNYQLFPGDRIYVKADHWIEFDNVVAKITAPAERIIGFTLLGHGLVRALQFGHRNTGGGGGGGGF